MTSKEIIKNFNESAVEIIDCNNKTYKGWFIINDNKYKLFPFNTIWETYAFKLCHIKSIKHLTNNFEIKNTV